MKYDSPQCGQDHIGIPSTTRRNAPLPNVRATRRSCAPARPQEAHRDLCEVDRDNVEDAREVDFDDRFAFPAIESPPLDNSLGFARCAIFLALDDAAREEDIFEIEDREIVIFQFFGGVERYDIVYATNQAANTDDRKA